MEIFKAAAELRVHAPIDERMALAIIRLSIAFTCIASGLIGMALACAVVGAAISLIIHSISLVAS